MTSTSCWTPVLKPIIPTLTGLKLPQTLGHPYVRRLVSSRVRPLLGRTRELFGAGLVVLPIMKRPHFRKRSHFPAVLLPLVFIFGSAAPSPAVTRLTQK